MKDILIQNTEIASYFLWEYTRHLNAIDTWYCTEDICLYLEIRGILSADDMLRYIKMSKSSCEYIEFVRNIAYRLHLSTKNDDAIKNWFITERLLNNKEWREAVATISNYYRIIRTGKGNSIDMIRTEWIRNRLLR